MCYRRLLFLRSSSLLRFRFPAGFFVIAPASYCLSPEKQCRSQSSTLRRPLHLNTLSPTLNLLHGSPRAFQSLSFQRLHTPQTPVNSLISTFRLGPTHKLCSSDVSSAQNDVRASALQAFPVCAHLHVNPGRTSLCARTYT